MRKFLFRLIALALSLTIIDLLFSSVTINGTGIISLTIVLALLNTFLKPLLELIGLPITIFTFGIFSLMINAFVLQLSFSLVANATCTGGFLTVFFMSILLSIINALIQGALGVKKIV